VVERMTTSEAREQFSEIINRAAYGKERVVLSRRGKALVAVVPIEDVRLLEALENRWDLAAAQAAIATATSEDVIPWELAKAERKRAPSE
jgi:prevent-host-death family protein